MQARLLAEQSVACPAAIKPDVDARHLEYLIQLEDIRAVISTI
jgi:hypothetical protein